MAKVKYYYDTKTLSYKRIELSKADKIKNLFYFLIGSAFIGLVIGIIFLQFFDSPKEKILQREIKQLNTQYEIVQDKLQQVELVLDDIQHRDDNIYRVIFEADPIRKTKNQFFKVLGKCCISRSTSSGFKDLKKS